MTMMLDRQVASLLVEPNILDRAKVGALIGVSEKTVSEYRLRYRNTDHPFPEPSGHFGRSPYWTADRADEIKRWATTRTGRGNPMRRTAN